MLSKSEWRNLFRSKHDRLCEPVLFGHLFDRVNQKRNNFLLQFDADLEHVWNMGRVGVAGCQVGAFSHSTVFPKWYCFSYRIIKVISCLESYPTSKPNSSMSNVEFRSTRFLAHLERTVSQMRPFWVVRWSPDAALFSVLLWFKIYLWTAIC